MEKNYKWCCHCKDKRIHSVYDMPYNSRVTIDACICDVCGHPDFYAPPGLITWTEDIEKKMQFDLQKFLREKKKNLRESKSEIEE